MNRRSAFRVPKYRTLLDPGFESDGDDGDYEASPQKSAKGKERETELPTSIPRHQPEYNLDFLSPPSTSTSAFADPSSDLLKCIHHFACQYYSDRGQLFNDTRAYRKEMKRRRLAKKAKKDQEEAEEQQDDDAASQADPPDDVGEPQDDVGEPQDDVGEPQEDDETQPHVVPPRKTKKTQRRDMYKTLDGSALLAVGMLLQEHIARLLAPNIPEGWEDELKSESEDEGSENKVEQDLDGEDGKEDGLLIDHEEDEDESDNAG